ncbi:hypothetical protein Hamer_G021778 [Homarus americanus]|uniref:Uncharacterized protein n=1 Tax=Homarus americanus TaxID=6706 RepID=A0A8J5K7B0_HOMAM|nr:hypothetical protein Hamer_G021778 [Homarus americanus]
MVKMVPMERPSVPLINGGSGKVHSRVKMQLQTPQAQARKDHRAQTSASPLKSP